MSLKIFLPIAIIVLFSQTVFSHESECLKSGNTEYSRLCIERLIPRSLDPINRNMMQPSVVKVSNHHSVSGSLTQDNRPLIVVIGASGRTGRLVLEGLAKRDLRIRALSRDIAKASADIGGNYEWVQADVTQPESLVMALQDSDIIIVNPGSVGQPRDRIPGAAWAIWDTKTNKIEFMREKYNYDVVLDECKKYDSENIYLQEVLTRS